LRYLIELSVKMAGLNTHILELVYNLLVTSCILSPELFNLLPKIIEFLHYAVCEASNLLEEAK
jgi:hypothetical protein